jgi:multiple sugar transport system ATP-binding protein
MRTELQQLQERLDITTVYVTHDQKEAMTMGDKVAVLDDGTLRQFGPPESVYEDPDERFVADFLGNPAMNQLPAVTQRDDDRLRLEADLGSRSARVASVPASDVPLNDGDPVTVGVRPEALRLEEPTETDVTRFDAHVSVTEYQGNDNFVHLRVGDRQMTAVVPPTVQPAADDRVTVSVPSSAVHLFDSETGATLRNGPS